MEVLQICPNLPPAIDGIGDYAFTLAKGLLQQNIHTHFMTFRQENALANSIEQFPIIQLPTDSPQAFVDAIPKQIQWVILHFSDYPYDPKRGAPFWLVNALALMKRERSLKLLIMFHEFPSFYLLKKTFYRFPWQQSVAWNLAKLADVVITNNAVTKTMLAKRLHQPIINLPVFSNIGELEQPPLLKQRQRRLIVFGTAGRRARIYQRSQAMLINCCQLLGIEEIWDIGPSLQLEQTEVAGMPLVQKGKQSAEAISRLLSESIAGIVHSTDNGRLAKSGVFATYCAHGLVPIVTQEQSPLMDGLQANVHFLFAGRHAQPLSMSHLQSIAENAHQWYNQHNQINTVKGFASQLLETVNR
ncbi:MAG: glycosyltransferase family 1 protein [Verrucomicrobia bacterium]|nr:glycosyltransferase family 1 protein [Leptolyngbya sp. ES-bin-22]